ncbi:MAG: type I-E CRISPR-associated endonuclease Cas1e [Candidatus Aminicenantes bacterium]|nr:type I-E CRISPR-associated endonuclease Cas1e [Candidatus Aminicenantes bacterium]
MPQDLHELPKIRDSLSFLYLEHCIIDQKLQAVEAIDADKGRTLIPVAALTTLILGPGTSITHAAIKTLAANGCLVMWCGEEGIRYYAHGQGETRRSLRLIHQAWKCSIPSEHMRVVMNMYGYRFYEPLSPNLSLSQVRGLEGVRVRNAYKAASQKFGIPWHGRKYDSKDWAKADSLNRALSTANACLNGICHSAIVSAGYSPGLGFIHVGKQLSFVYDIADLYKVEITIPIAFQTVLETPTKLESDVRHKCRDIFKDRKLLDRIILDLDKILEFSDDWNEEIDPLEQNGSIPEVLWSPENDPIKCEISDGDHNT